ncbi:TPA: hypothetical protein NIC80_000500 [Pseudomonas aeruginosa]|uniref:hypothetical protein n=1 Tax=Pseudomonas aeruginosa TaxID=287 RepID=UPI000B11A324|nr:hypothetical protein [Pseudomonas aeruginosa]ELH7263373.1 hypothetical protein [Pseudomonas aeruginosa]ELL1154623.1 hypothetical protein [Pseudomonas aeruginosa]MCS9387041.1 hypothetical protein [Pseudomonas aeruginosa]MDC3860832.1 hypothetical protein [Pseudomonas aeruginosa]MDC3892187.1 hypothetical protein [Pseudomonas aeruginosa]
MHTGETLAAAPPARPLRQSRLGGLSLFLALAGVAIALAVMALALGERIDLSDENHLLGLFAALLAVFAVSTCGLVLGLAGLLRRSRKRHLALAGIVLNLSPALGLACAEHGGGRDPDGPGANRVVVPQRPGGAVRHDLLPPGLTRSATVRRQPGRPPFGRSFIGLPDCGHSSRICRGRGLSRGRRVREEQKVSPGGADLRGSCGTVVRAPGRDQRWKG